MLHDQIIICFDLCRTILLVIFRLERASEDLEWCDDGATGKIVEVR